MFHSKRGRRTSLSSLALAAAALIAAPQMEVSAAAGYSDVEESGTHFEAIQSLTEQGIIQGYEDGTFRQWQDVKRQHTAVMLAEAADVPVPEDVEQILNQYEDVDIDHMYAEEIAAVTQAGIFSGNEEGEFHPSASITRQQTASVLVPALSLRELDGESDEVDVNLDNVHASHDENVQTLADLELTTQLDDFRPGESVSRGAFSTFVHRAQDLKEQESGGSVGEGSEEGAVSSELTIMHTNDIHAHLDVMPKLATAVENYRVEHPDSLLLDAGDMFSGTLYFNEFQGQAGLELMNLMNYDMATFGNHEFDLGSSSEGHQALSEFVSGAAFPFVSSNLDFSQDANMSGLFHDEMTEEPEDGQIYNSIVKEVNGEKIGVFGLTTSETADISSPADVSFEDYIESSQEAVNQFEDAGVNKVIALTHIGYDDNPEYDNDLQLAEQVDGIDVIVGSHTHTELSEPDVVGEDSGEPTVIVQASQYGEFLGTLQVGFNDSGVVTEHQGELIEIGEQAENEEAAAALAPYAAQIDEVQNEESGGVAAEALPNPRLENGDDTSVRNSETKLGNLITDAMLAKAKEYNEETTAALQNGGGIRTSIDQGPITNGEIISVLPFGNTLATMEITGAELKQALEHSVSQVPAENGGFLHVSGMTYTYDSSNEAGNRIQTVEIKQDGDFTPVEDDQQYVVATNAFTAKGGDGYDVFADLYDEGRVTDLGLSDWQNLRDHVAELGTVDPEIEERIVDVNNN
ncbi:5'-nucleotidase C-terminal domain-containing protein [Salibacterium qingdaonense]|uniref:2',3'-cyclic-nucleotide 2'-phosphodiesterase / 3'-nucleotidase / 5'-nucleotidase n=1 Tax=Salibacterium qingdaonense TaxID=266892 RepID=A0A1I4KQ38_9BACI|nr:5'-nucleotidase C-terminal domain-containing protein [Salibacterium qingdaonense]SFL80567.1 2',3'-cyclic-nucleotide 2'-phosphodiesterase / 3'-nucleotidase / 5'-nucleotidase [Salibacterium qingdaonense]